MLSSILKKQDCAECKFCCSFRRKSLWETPLFTKEIAEQLSKLYPDVRFRPAGNQSVTVDLIDEYKTSDPEEEVPCPFLEQNKGCILPPELKPFDCSIWPLRVVKKTEKNVIALTPTCPAINRLPRNVIIDLVKNEIGEKILDYAKKNPDIIKDSSVFLSDVIY